MTELKKEPVYVLLQCANDVANKQFQNILKTSFPPTHMVCSMKGAVDMASKGKPPLIKPPTPDALSLGGDLVNTVVHNWVVNQLKKPPPKVTPAKKPPPKKGAKGADIPQETTPRTEPEIPGPYFIYITEYPKNSDQVTAMIDSATPIICAINLEVAAAENEKRPAATPTQQAATVDIKNVFPQDIPFVSYTIQPTGANEEIAHQLHDDLARFYNAFIAFRKVSTDIRLVKIPKYPPEVIPIPQLPAEKPAKGSASKANIPAITPVELPSVTDDALKSAYKLAVFEQLDEFLKKANSPTYSSNFQHAAELLPKFPLPASLSDIFTFKPNKKDPQIFTMRSASYKERIPYADLFSVFVCKKFEEIIGYPIGERRHTELIPLEFLSNVLAPLRAIYTNIKWSEFAGCTLLAFYHSIPDTMPVLTVSEEYNLPVYEGFAHWMSDQEPFPETLTDEPPQTDFSANAGSNDLFLGLPCDRTAASHTRYYCESGMRVDSYPTETAADGAMRTSFCVTYNNSSRVSFNIKQRPPQSQGAGEEEEDEDGPAVDLTARGALAKDCEFLFESSPARTRFSLFTRGSCVEYDPADPARSIVMVGAAGETHRVIAGGRIIRFGADETVVYRRDGSVETRSSNGEHQLVNGSGEGFRRINGRWFRDPALDATSETLETHFTKRRVVNRSNGVSFIEDDGETTVVFPDGTRFLQTAESFTHPSYPDVCVGEEDRVVLRSDVFSAAFGRGTVQMELANNEASLNLSQDSGHLMIYFGPFKNVMTMVDLLMGTVANVGARRCVYYLNDEWQWALGRQLCSKKEIVQHFQDGDFVERLQPVDRMERDELEAIIETGHKPRLFIIERESGTLAVRELLASSEFQAIAEASSSRVSAKEEKDVTLWFDTNPKTYREMSIWTKFSEDGRGRIERAYEKEVAVEAKRVEILDSVGDPKWRELEREQEKEEADIIEFLKDFEK